MDKKITRNKKKILPSRYLFLIGKQLVSELYAAHTSPVRRELSYEIHRPSLMKETCREYFICRHFFFKRYYDGCIRYLLLVQVQVSQACVVTGIRVANVFKLLVSPRYQEERTACK